MVDRSQRRRGGAVSSGDTSAGAEKLAQPPPSSPPPHPPPCSSSSSADGGRGNGGNVDRLLFKNLVEMVPLVESLMDRRANSSYSRRASVVYTPAPSQSKKAADTKAGRTAHSISAKKRRDHGENAQKSNQDADNGDDYSIILSKAMAAEKDREEMAMLREQISDLQKKLLEKDEALKSAENTVNQMSASYGILEEQVAEKDSLLKSTTSQLQNAKILLADKQAALEKLEWEAKMSNRKIEELQGDVDSMDFEITALMKAFEKLSENDSATYSENGISSSLEFEPLQLAVDEIDNDEIQKMEEERAAYVAALTAVKENPSDDFLSKAAEARLRLRAFVV
uniref:Protein MICROTUBULE BINDING PROTEIN 2C n=1 Tax=Ananas comosus var. bracteatus TaxID=296719 RepID=A0A6V7QQU7_ANACO